MLHMHDTDYLKCWAGWTGQPILIRQNFRRLCVQPLCNILQKVMIYKYESNNDLTIDPDCPEILTSVQVPVFPQAKEVIRTSDDKLLQVSSVDTERKTIQGLPIT